MGKRDQLLAMQHCAIARTEAHAAFQDCHASNARQVAVCEKTYWELLGETNLVSHDSKVDAENASILAT